MTEPVVLKSKANLATKVALIIAVIMILIGVVSSLGGVENTRGRLMWAMVITVAALIIKKKLQRTTNHYTIVNDVADAHYQHTRTPLDTRPANVRTSSGGVGETYVEFLNEVITFLYRIGEGTVSVEPGRTIETIKADQQENKIALKMAEMGMSQEREANRLSSVGARPVVDTARPQNSAQSDRKQQRR